jgi:hypothetical protein
MPGKSQPYSDAVLNVLRGTSITGVSPYLGLFSVAPADDSSAGTELAGNGYARQAIVFDAPVGQPIPFHAPASTQRYRAGGGCFRDLLRVRRNTPHSDYSGGSSRPREHRRRAPGISRFGRGGGGFRGNFHTSGCPPNGPWDCRRFGHCWRTVGPCAPLGWHRQWYCQPASAVGRGARIGRNCGWLLAARGKTAAGIGSCKLPDAMWANSWRSVSRR